MARLLFIMMTSTFLIGLFPISDHMSSMQAMHTDMGMTSYWTSPQSNNDEENEGDNSTGSCCVVMGPFLLTCDFMVSPPAYISKYGGGERVVNSIAVIHSIYIEDVTPPPKA
jgi:hypothetical protein